MTCCNWYGAAWISAILEPARLRVGVRRERRVCARDDGDGSDQRVTNHAGAGNLAGSIGRRPFRRL